MTLNDTTLTMISKPSENQKKTNCTSKCLERCAKCKNGSCCNTCLRSRNRQLATELAQLSKSLAESKFSSNESTHKSSTDSKSNGIAQIHRKLELGQQSSKNNTIQAGSNRPIRQVKPFSIETSKRKLQNCQPLCDPTPAAVLLNQLTTDFRPKEFDYDENIQSRHLIISEEIIYRSEDDTSTSSSTSSSDHSMTSDETESAEVERVQTDRARDNADYQIDVEDVRPAVYNTSDSESSNEASIYNSSEDHSIDEQNYSGASEDDNDEEEDY